MTWRVAWSLILGFTLSAIVQALVRKSTIARLLTDDSPKSLVAAATRLGVASSPTCIGIAPHRPTRVLSPPLRISTAQ